MLREITVPVRNQILAIQFAAIYCIGYTIPAHAADGNEVKNVYVVQILNDSDDDTL